MPGGVIVAHMSQGASGQLPGMVESAWVVARCQRLPQQDKEIPMADGQPNSGRIVESLEKLMIIQLALAKVPHQKIRKIVGGDMNRVTAIARHLKSK